MKLTEAETKQILEQRANAERKRVWWETCPKKNCAVCGAKMWAENPHANCLSCDLL